MTIFEDTQGETLTPLTEEADLIAGLESTGAATVTELGTSTDGRFPIRLVKTTGAPAGAPRVLFIGMQHGNEPVGRESVLSLMRDLAENTGLGASGLTDRVEFFFIPTANPGSFPSYRDVRPIGLNINREHLNLGVLEAQYIQQAITDIQPDLIIDCHEHFSTLESRLRAEMLPGSHPSSPARINEASDNLMAYVQNHLDDEAIPHGLYSPAQVNPYTLRGMASIRGAAFLLVETPALNNTIPRWQRYQWYHEIMVSVTEWISDYLPGEATAIRLARSQIAGQVTPLDLGAAVVVRPEAYLLDHVPEHLDIFGIEYEVDDGITRVPLAQESAPLIVHLFDVDSPEPVVVGIRVERTNPEPAPPQVPLPTTPLLGYRVHVDGLTRDVIGIRARIDGRVRDVLMPSGQQVEEES